MTPCLPPRTTRKSQRYLHLILALVSVIILLFASQQDRYIEAQTTLFITLNNGLSVLPATFWLTITLLGDALIVLSLLAVLAIIQPRAWAGIFASIPLAILLTRSGKSLLSMPRPAAMIEHDQITIIGNALMGANSTPSGHTITAFTAITVIIYFLPAGKKALHASTALIIATLVALSRIAVGAHWPADVLLGAIFGYASGLSGIYLVNRYRPWWQWTTDPRRRYIRSAILMLFPAVILTMLLKGKYPNISITWLSIASGLATSVFLLRQKTA